jgi:hypothetical protein
MAARRPKCDVRRPLSAVTGHATEREGKMPPIVFVSRELDAQIGLHKGFTETWGSGTVRLGVLVGFSSIVFLAGRSWRYANQYPYNHVPGHSMSSYRPELNSPPRLAPHEPNSGSGLATICFSPKKWFNSSETRRTRPTRA